MKKRLLSLFLAWAVCLTMLPAMALADEEPETEPAAQEQTAEEPESEPVAQSEDDAEPVMNETEFRNAVAAGGEIKLTGNVTLTSEGAGNSALPRVTVQKNVQLDLNGYTITANFNDYVFAVSQTDRNSTDYPTLTLNDTRSGGKITHGTYLDDSGTEKTYISSGVYVYKGNFVMNGGTITGNVSTYTDGAGVEISSSSGDKSSSTFTMTGGAITGNLGARTGGVSLFTNGALNQCTFTMTGGTISGNQATGGNRASVGGVYLCSSAFTMTGGSITGNNSTVTDTSYSTTGGVLVTSSVLQPAVTVGGTAQICDNWISGEKSGDSYVKGDDGVAGNVYLGTSNGTISISADTALTSDAKIGVTTNTEPTSGVNLAFATGAKDTDKASFFSDKGNGIVYNSVSEQLEMQAVAHSHDDGEGFMHTLASNESSQLVIDGVATPLDHSDCKLPAGSYVLTGNLELEHRLAIDDAEVSICLNGYNIQATKSGTLIWLTNKATLTITDHNDIANAGKITHTNNQTGGGVWVHNSTFKLNGGSISGNDSRNKMYQSGYGGGVDLETDGTIGSSSKFIMTGGSITGNRSDHGGGVYVSSGCQFEMTGGIITGNYSTKDADGNGVYLSPHDTSGSIMTVSGTAQIYGNSNNIGNVTGNSITIGEGGLTEGAKICLSSSTALADGEYETVATNVDAESANYLFSDNRGYKLFRNAEDNTLVLFNGTPHAHKICGDTSCTDHTEDVLFESKLYVDDNGTLKATGKTITSGGSGSAAYYTLPAGHYYLGENITLDNERLRFDGAVTICLNGHSINSESQTSQVLDIDGNVVTLTNCQTYGGVIRHTSPDVSGVYVDHQGIFNMYGGTITNHTRGVVVESGTFNMYGGSITDNSLTSNTSSGAGVYVYSSGTMNIRGKVNITGNKVAGAENNVYLASGKTITVDGKLDAASRIGVSTDLSCKPESVDIAIAKDASCVSSGNFLSDDSTYHVGIDGKTVKLMAHAHEWAYSADGATITATCTASDCKSTNGGSVTVSAPTHTVYRDNKDANAVVTPGNDWAAAAIGDISVTYDGGSTTAPTDAGNHTASISLTGVDGKTATATVAYTIAKATLTADDFTFTASDENDLVYNGSAKTVFVTSDNVTDSDITVHYFRYGEETAPVNAGDYTFMIDVKETKNFEKAAGLTKDGVWTFTITPADLNVSRDQNVNIRYTDTAEKTYTAADLGITVGGAFFERGNVTDASSVLETDYPKIENGAVRVKLKSGLELNNQTVTIPLRFLPNSTNYNAKEITLTITLSEKDAQEPLEITSAGEMSYNDTLTLTAEGGSTDSAVEWSIADGGDKAEIVNGVLIPKGVGTVTVTAAKPGDDQFSDVVATKTITIKQATITITAKNQTAKVGDEKAPDLTGQYEISGLAEGETLKTLPTIAYAETPDLTKTGTVAITVRGAEAPDSGNYNEIVYKNGTLTISARLSSGGGGGGSSSAPKYTVTVPSGTTGGTVKSNVSTAASGGTVTITVTPEDGYKLDSLTVTDAKGNDLKLTDKGNGKYSFTMPDGKVDIKPVFVKEAASEPADGLFRDVSANDYFYEPVKWAKENGITGGVSATLFAPHDGCTRAHTVTFLWRAAGSPEPKTTATFSDVVAGSYYAKAVSWAIENGITNGTSATTFSPDAICTRAHSVTFLYRAAKAAPLAGDLVFHDVAADAYYAAAVKWATAQGITNGISSTQFGPDASCTRAQIVTFLYRLLNK